MITSSEDHDHKMSDIAKALKKKKKEKTSERTKRLKALSENGSLQTLFLSSRMRMKTWVKSFLPLLHLTSPKILKAA